MNANATNNGRPGGRPRKKPTAKVKVVASRYALSLKKTNEEARVGQVNKSRVRQSQQSVRAPAASAPVDTRKRASAISPVASVAMQDIRTGLTVNSSGRVLGLADSSSRSRSASGSASAIASTPVNVRSQLTATPTPTAGSKRHLADTTPGSMEVGRGATYGSVSASGAPQDMKARLEAYRASKQHRTQQDAAHVHARNASTTATSTGLPDKRVQHATSNSGEAFSARTPSSARPAFPKRIASAAAMERATKQSTPSASPVASRHTKLSPRYTKHTDAVLASSKAVPAVHHNDSEELELLQSLYYQLCFVEAKGDATFRRQEETAQQQMIGAWEVLQSKLQLLHDTTLRLDKEWHIANLETHLAQQAAPVTAVAAHLPPLLGALTRVCSSLASALYRMPTHGVTCSPDELKRHMDALTVNLDEVLEQLTSTRLDELLSSAVRFERAMREASDKLNASLMQLAHLLEEVHVEIDTETSVAIQKIQQLRVDSTATREVPNSSAQTSAST